MFKIIDSKNNYDLNDESISADEVTEKHPFSQGRAFGVSDCDICRFCGCYKNDEIHIKDDGGDKYLGIEIETI